MTAAIIPLAVQYERYGYRRVTALLRAGVAPAAGDNDADQPEHVPSQNARRFDREQDALLENKIKKVLAKAKKEWPDPKTWPGIMPMAVELARTNRGEIPLDCGEVTIRKILDG